MDDKTRARMLKWIGDINAYLDKVAGLPIPDKLADDSPVGKAINATLDRLRRQKEALSITPDDAGGESEAPEPTNAR